jgi:N-glycosylase/DNA lyase
MAVTDKGTCLYAAVRVGGVPVLLDITAASSGIAVEWRSGHRDIQTDVVRDAARRLLRLDDDLSLFYELVGEDDALAWAAAGAGRLIRSMSVFEEVVKTLCTTNCSWAATTRMLQTLVSNLGEPVGSTPPAAPTHAFPTPAAMAAAGETFYANEMRAGYRSRYLLAIAEAAAADKLALEDLAAPAVELPDAEVEERLLALPGVGPYASAHIMLQLGRYSSIVLDSWTRPAFGRLTGRRSVSDVAIRRRFRQFGDFAGLAFWVFVTQEWVEDTPGPAGNG